MDNSKFPDLQVTQYFDPSDKNYFNTDVKGLAADTLYGFNFQWVFEDEDLNTKYNTLWSNTFRVQTIPLPLAESTDVAATWGEDSLQVTWKSPTHSTGFQIALTGNVLGIPKTVYFGHKKDLTTINQKIVLTKQQIMANFGNVFQTTLSGLLKTDYINSASPGVPFVIPPYVDPLSGLAILDSSWLITPVDKGFSVSWDAISTTGTYWETVVYKSSTPTGTYLPVGSATNAPVIVKEINTVYIKIRHRLITGEYSAYSNYKEAKAYIPIVFDTTPPNEVTVNSAEWSGNDIVINYTMPATDPASRFKITLVNGAKSGNFYEYPGGQTGTHTVTIYDDKIYQQFDGRYSSYTGNFISIDASENPTSGTEFSVGAKTNPLVDLTPLYTLISLANGYVAKFSNTNTSIAYIEVYAKSTSFGFVDPVTGVIEAQYLVYSGANPGTVISTDYTTKYIKARYFTISGQHSRWSEEKQISASDPGSLSLIDNPVKISTHGSIFTGNLDSSGQPIQSGARVFFNRTGLYVYDSLTTAPTTQIIGNAAPAIEGDLNTVAPTFITTRAKIADWIIYPDRFENALTATTGTYTGLAPTGSYAFWAGGNSSKNTDGLAKFSVTHAGAVTARNISIIGDGTSDTKIINAGSFFVQNDGYLEASRAKITGEINASTGVFKGQVDIGTAALPDGQLRIASSSGTILIGHGVTINGVAAAGITASVTSGSPAVTTTNFWVRASDGYLMSKLGEIGGWAITENKLSAGGGANAVGLATSGTYAFWAGAAEGQSGTSPNIVYAPFSVTNTGILRATNAIIGGTIKATDGFIGSDTTGWTFNSTSITSRTPSGKTPIVLDGSNATISGGTISGTTITGTTITGGIVQTSSSTADRRIVIDVASKESILFKGALTDSTLTDGRIAAGFGNGIFGGGSLWTSNFPSLTISAPTVTINPPSATAYPAIIGMSNTSGGGVIEISATWTRLRGYLELLNGFDYTTQAVRMISAGPSAPGSTIGKEGSIYFQIG